jgi:hypothetical protein
VIGDFLFNGVDQAGIDDSVIKQSIALIMATSTTTETIHLSTLPMSSPPLTTVFDRSTHNTTSTSHDIVVDETPSSSLGREAGERDPLLLRGRIMGEGELMELRK